MALICAFLDMIVSAAPDQAPSASSFGQF